MPVFYEEAEFDMDDPESAKIAGKVQRGYLKGTSMGFIPAENDDRSWNFVKGPDGIPDLMSCELMESSIVALPSNKSALHKLYANDGSVLAADTIKLSLSSTQQIPNLSMNKLTLSIQTLLVLGLQSVDNPTEVSEKIEKLALEHSANIEKLKAADQLSKDLQTKLDAVEQKEAVAMIDGAINEGKLNAAQRDSMLTLAKTDFDGAKAIIEGLGKKNTLSDHIKNPELDASKVKTDEDFQKLSTAEQLAFKANHPEEYAKLFA
jgi:hypothetical protein